MGGNKSGGLAVGQVMSMSAMPDFLHATLLANVKRWADALAPGDPYSDDDPEAPAIRLNKLVKEAAGPFPVLVVAHREETCYHGGDIEGEAFFETFRCYDAVALIDWLAELEVKYDVVDGEYHSTIEIHRLAHRPRIDEDGFLTDEVMRTEHVLLDARVKIKVADMTEDKRKAAAVASQARRVSEAERTRKRELAKLAELRAKYENGVRCDR